MSLEQLKAFIEKIKGDKSLQDKLKAAKSSDEVVSIAKDHGHDFGAEHISQLSEEELEGVAGGRGGPNPSLNPLVLTLPCGGNKPCNPNNF